MSDCCDKKCDSGLTIPPFVGFTEFTATIPKLYFDVKSQEQRILALCKQLHKMICYADFLSQYTNQNIDDIKDIKKQFDKFMQSGFDDYYADQVEAWINKNLEYVFTHVAKQVYFGLTLDGHFVAYIPESWSDIVFDTGAVYGEDTYGRLLLRWDVDESGEEVNQRPEIWNTAEVTDDYLDHRILYILDGVGLLD